MFVSIIIPTLNEEQFIEQSLQSIRNQNYADNYEIILVDSGSTDGTVELASQYVDHIINAPRGKLTARNIATAQSNGDIIVSVDADCYYPENWLVNLLQSFEENEYGNEYGNIVGVRGRTIHYDENFAWNKMWTLVEDIDMTIIHRNRMLGRNCAYYKDSFYLSGGFDESINQQDVYEMMQEEEIGFGNRLSQIGALIYAMNAECYHLHLSEDKMICRFLTKLPGYNGSCGKYGIGTERF